MVLINRRVALSICNSGLEETIKLYIGKTSKIETDYLFIWKFDC